MKPTTFLLAAGLMLAGTFTLRAAVEFDWASIGDAGNAADATGYGAVDYEFKLATTEVNLAQYTEFLNVVAKTDPYGLYNPRMNDPSYAQEISRSGTDGSFTYSVLGSGALPVTYVSVYDAMRFVNWLNNGQGNGSTETGAYTISTGSITRYARTNNVATLTTSAAHTLSVGDQVTVSGVDTWFDGTYVVTAVTETTFSYALEGADVGPTNQAGSMTGASARHSEDAVYWLPTEDEWYKAAYYDPTKGEAGGYWLYPTQSDTLGGNTIGQPHSANYGYEINGHPTDGGAYGDNSASYYGTFDQGGNVWEWNAAQEQDPGSGYLWKQRGGSWASGEGHLKSSFGQVYSVPIAEFDSLGFRVASIPEPSEMLLVALGGVMFLVCRTRRNRL
ncbi:MAG TPA: SUMF1/EgtB/PvdO family nonheme iron enzyme [Chthoniobacteraceae bacterium]|nr:SUMF1/EgtB/PvdO family nonheme iron enzyme [Chthoniobacteraceae bacterium]